MKWFLFVIFLSGAEPKNYSAFFGDTEDECKEAKEFMERVAKARGARIWADCFRWTPPPEEKPKGDPATEQRS